MEATPRLYRGARARRRGAEKSAVCSHASSLSFVRARSFFRRALCFRCVLPSVALVSGSNQFVGPRAPTQARRRRRQLSMARPKQKKRNQDGDGEAADAPSVDAPENTLRLRQQTMARNNAAGGLGGAAIQLASGHTIGGSGGAGEPSGLGVLSDFDVSSGDDDVPGSPSDNWLNVEGSAPATVAASPVQHPQPPAMTNSTATPQPKDGVAVDFRNAVQNDAFSLPANVHLINAEPNLVEVEDGSRALDLPRCASLNRSERVFYLHCRHVVPRLALSSRSHFSSRSRFSSLASACAAAGMRTLRSSCRSPSCGASGASVASLVASGRPKSTMAWFISGR